MARDHGRDFFDDDVFDEDEEDTLADMYLTFRLGAEDYGVAILHVTEIIAIQRITEVPDMPSFVKGVINLRGYVIPVIDMRLRFQLPAKAYNERTCVVVVHLNEIMVGLIVDAVEDVLNIPEQQISLPSEMLRGVSSPYVQGMGKVEEAVIILLDVEKLLFETEKNQLASVQQQGALL